MGSTCMSDADLTDWVACPYADIFFSLHALGATLYIQCVVFKQGGQQVSQLCKLVGVSTVLVATG